MENSSSKTRQRETFAESRNVTNIKFASFIGVDLHKTTVTLRAVDPSENIISSLTMHTKCVNKIEDWITALPKPRWMSPRKRNFGKKINFYGKKCVPI